MTYLNRQQSLEHSGHSIRVYYDTYQKLKIMALEERRTIAGIISVAVDTYIKRSSRRAPRSRKA